MKIDQIKLRIEQLAPSTRVEIYDLTGTQDHYQAMVVSSIFEEKIMIEQHRAVLDLFQKEIDSGELHALSLKTYTPEQYRRFVLKES